MNYYIADTTAGTHHGPYTVDQLRGMAITPDTLVWNETMRDWARAIDVPELRSALFPTAPGASIPHFAPGDAHDRTAPAPIPPRPHTWLAESIIATLLCFMPFGIVAIVKAAQVSSAYERGDYDEALRCSKSAKTWVIWSVIAPIILFVGMFLLIAAGAVSLAALENL